MDNPLAENDPDSGQPAVVMDEPRNPGQLGRTIASSRDKATICDWNIAFMIIQEVAAQVTDALGTLEDDYQSAVVHVAWNYRQDTQDRVLLFAFVELLPVEIPPPIDDYDPKSGTRLGGNSKNRVHVRHAVVPAKQAYSWYLECRRGIVRLPTNDGQLPEASDGSTKNPAVGALGEEPQWPTLLTAADDTDAIPFCPQWIKCPRVHHLIPVNGFAFGLWSEDERKRATLELEGKLHFSLEDYPEYWGSVHLIAPNPVYRHQHTRLQKRDSGSEAEVTIFEPRACKSVKGLTLAFQERGVEGASDVRYVTIQSELLRFSFCRRINAIREEVFDPKRGALWVSNNPYVFLSSIETRMHLARTLVVKASPNESYEVTRTGRGDVMRIGEAGPILPSARAKMGEGQRLRKRRSQAIQQDQRWFRGQVDEARAVLRRIIHSAKTDVLFVDPYFGAAEIVNFALAVGQDDLPIQVLTSAEHLKSRIGSNQSDTRQGEALRLGLQNLRDQGYSNRFDIRVMLGDPPPVHDRFLVIDEHVWLLGSSLNSFGSRGTMMVSIPDPVPVRAQLLHSRDEAISLEDWLANRDQGEVAVAEGAP